MGFLFPEAHEDIDWWKGWNFLSLEEFAAVLDAPR